MKRILVTGIAEHLGSHVVKLAAERGYLVRGISNNPDDKLVLRQLKSIVPQNLEIINAPPKDLNVLRKAVKGCNHILHLADFFVGKNPREANEQMKQETNVLLKAASQYKVKSMIIKGSMFNLGLQMGRSDKLFNEDSWGSINDKVPAVNEKIGYVMAKIKLEQETRKYMETLPDSSQFDLSFVHPTIIYGPVIADTVSLNLFQIREMLIKKRAYFHTCLPVTDVRDVAVTCLSAMEHPKTSKGRFICCGGTVWLDKMPRIIESEFAKDGYRCRRTIWPILVMRLLKRFVPQVQRFTMDDKVEIEVNNEWTKKELGVTFRPVKDTIIDTVSSMIENDLIPSKKQAKLPEKKTELPK